MKKFLNVILNLSGVILGVIVFGVTAAIIANTMLTSYKNYKIYEEKYYQNDLDVRSLKEASPNRIAIEDDFVEYNDDGSVKSTTSSYKNELTVWANDLNINASQEQTTFVQGNSIFDSYIPTLEKGGTIALYLYSEEKTFLDLDFVISSEHANEEEDGTTYGVEKLLNNVSFIINGEVMEDEDIDLLNGGNGVEWHHLVMAGFALPAGHITIEIKNNSGKADLMPEVRNISVFTSQPVMADNIGEPTA